MGLFFQLSYYRKKNFSIPNTPQHYCLQHKKYISLFTQRPESVHSHICTCTTYNRPLEFLNVRNGFAKKKELLQKKIGGSLNASSYWKKVYEQKNYQQKDLSGNYVALSDFNKKKNVCFTFTIVINIFFSYFLLQVMYLFGH